MNIVGIHLMVVLIRAGGKAYAVKDLINSNDNKWQWVKQTDAVGIQDTFALGWKDGVALALAFKARRYSINL